MKDLAMFLLNASVQAGWLALALIAVRLMFRKAPKKLLCALWALVGLRLAVPVSLRSVFSLLPSETPVTASNDVGGVNVRTGLPPVDNTVNSFLQIAAAPAAPTRELAAQTAIDWKTVFAVVWICGVAVMLLYAAVSFLRLRLQVREAVKEEGNVYLCDRVGTPFILGVVRPRIYLPSSLDAGDRAMILLHERAHLKRRDHLWKPLGFLLLSVYWFNPVLWVVYVLLCRDIELACDERVLRQQGSEIKKEYASALLRCSAPRRLVRACPVAFGEVGVKARIKSVLNYKKPAFWVILLALVASAVVAVCFMTVPKERAPASVTVLNTGSDSEAVTVQPESVSLDRQTLRLEVTYVNNSDQPIEANETVWMLRYADGAYAPLEVRNNDWDTTLRFRLPAQEQQTYNYTPSTFCDCTAPGAYRFQVHFRFADEPENSYPHLLWFDFKITSPEEPNALVPLPEGMDNAIHEVLLADNADGNWSGECATEGHVVYGVEQTGSTWKVYLYHSFERYGFINGCFTVVSGHWSVAVLTMELRDAGFICKQIDYPQDGSYNVPSIKRMFPKKLEFRALNPTQSDRDEVKRQCEAQAQAYLKTISRGRDALIVSYDQLDLQLPDLSAQVSNKLSNELGRMEGLYELTLGTREQLEKGVRYVYRTALLHDTNTLLLTKEVYGTDEVRELLLYSAETGDLLYHDGGREQPDELHCFNARVTDKPGQRNRLMMPTREDLFSNGVVVNTETFSGQSSKASEDEYVTVYFSYPVAESSPEQMPYVHAICYMADVYAFGNDPSSTAQTDVAWVPSCVILSFEATVTQARNGGALVKINRDAGTWKKGTEVNLNFAGTQWESLRPTVGTVLRVDYPINAEIAETYPPILSSFHNVSVLSTPDGEKTTEKPPEPTTQQRTTTAPPPTTKKSEPTTRTSEPFVPSTTMKTTAPTATTKPTEPTWTTRAYTPEEARAIQVLGEEAVERFPDLKNTTNPYLEKAYVLMNCYPKFKKANVKSYDIGQDSDGYQDVTLHTDKGDFVAKYDGKYGVCLSNNQEPGKDLGIEYYFHDITKPENVQLISLYRAYYFMMQDHVQFQGAFVRSFDELVEADKVTVTLHTDKGDCTVVMGPTGKYISTRA